MKRLIFIFMLGFLSCGDDEIDLSGNWDLAYLSIESCINISDNVFINLMIRDCTRINGMDVCYEAEVEFTSSEITTIITTKAGGASRTDTRNFTYTIDGEDMTICEGSNDCWQGSWTLEGDTFSFAGVGVQDGCSILFETVRR